MVSTLKINLPVKKVRTLQELLKIEIEEGKNTAKKCIDVAKRLGIGEILKHISFICEYISCFRIFNI